jgi:demethylmenaquinone methyltransferase / 2-methoxy-6-polyprenyl-1,4-benzoquinol methylase
VNALANNAGGPPAADPNAAARRLFSGLPRRYDALAELLSFGQNRRWRAEMVDHITAPPGGVVLDVASGTAGVAIRLASMTGARVVGTDLTETMLRRGASNLRRDGLSDRVRLLVGRAEQLPFADETFDALTFTYLLRYVADPEATVAEMARVVKPGGAVASLEFMVPPRGPLRALWWLYTRLLLPAAGRVFGREWYEVGRFLGPSISGFYRSHPVSAVVAAWEDAGLTDVRVRTMSLGGGIVMWGRKGDG